MDQRIARIKFVWLERVGFAVYWMYRLIPWLIVVWLLLSFVALIGLVVVRGTFEALPDLLDRVPTVDQARQLTVLSGIVAIALAAIGIGFQFRPKFGMLLAIAIWAGLSMVVIFDWHETARGYEGVLREVLFTVIVGGLLVSIVLSSRFVICSLLDGSSPPAWARYTVHRCRLCSKSKWVLRFVITTSEVAERLPFHVDPVCKKCRQEQRKPKRETRTYGEALVFHGIGFAAFLGCVFVVWLSVTVGVMWWLALLAFSVPVAWATLRHPRRVSTLIGGAFVFTVRLCLATKDWLRGRRSLPEES